MSEKFDFNAARNRLPKQIHKGLKTLPYKLLVESHAIAASIVGPYYENNDGQAEHLIDVMEAFSDELNERLERLERLKPQGV